MLPRSRPNRLLVAAIALLAAALVLAYLVAIGLRREPLLPRLDSVAVVELQRGPERLVLARSGERWVVRSAGDVPANEERVERLLRQLQALRADEGIIGDAPGASGTEIVLRDERGGTVAALALSPAPQDSERQVAIARAPADKRAVGAVDVGSLALERWAKVELPRLDDRPVTAVLLVDPGAAHRFERSPDGGFVLAPASSAIPGEEPTSAPPQLADSDGLEALVAVLTHLDPRGFVAGDAVNWAGARYVQLTRDDGLVIEAQATRRPDGGAWVRLNFGALPTAAASVRELAERSAALRRVALPVGADAAAPLFRDPASFRSPPVQAADASR